MSKILPRRLLCFGLLMTAVCILEFFIGFIPAAVKHTVSDIATALVVRFIFLAVSTGLVFNSFMFEYVVSLSDTNNRKPIVTEEKRINY